MRKNNLYGFRNCKVLYLNDLLSQDCTCSCICICILFFSTYSRKSDGKNIKENKNKVVSYIIFVFFPYFFHHTSCRKDQFTVLILKFGTQDFTDFTDPGLLDIQPTLTDLSLWFCLHKCF